MTPSTPLAPVALVLAAGKGTRMRSRHPKALLPLLGKPLVRYVLDLARELGIQRRLCVVGHGSAQVREALGPELEYIEQTEQRGTGHAVLCAAPALAGVEAPLLLLQADCVLLTADLLRNLLADHSATGAAATLLTTRLPDAGAYGRVLRNPDGSFRTIVEAAGASADELAVREINAGTYVFQPEALFAALRAVTPDPATGEVYLTSALRLLQEQGQRVELVVADDPSTARSVNDRVELSEAAAILRARILRRHMLAGVTLEDPATTYIDAEVEIGPDTTIRPMVHLCGSTVIGEECEIGPSVRITDCVLGNRVSVQSAVLAESEVGDGTRVGPFAQLRPGCKVGRKVKIGNFVELKKATVEDGASLGHFAYIGDASVGEKTNIGAGTITCNYDGKHKHRTVIGKRAFIGTHATLVAPVQVGDGAFVAAGTVVTEDVPEDALAIGRARQVVKEQWARKRREGES